MFRIIENELHIREKKICAAIVDQASVPHDQN